LLSIISFFSLNGKNNFFGKVDKGSSPLKIFLIIKNLKQNNTINFSKLKFINYEIVDLGNIILIFEKNWIILEYGKKKTKIEELSNFFFF